MVAGHDGAWPLGLIYDQAGRLVESQVTPVGTGGCDDRWLHLRSRYLWSVDPSSCCDMAEGSASDLLRWPIVRGSDMDRQRLPPRTPRFMVG
jgi:hypothetical protein